VLEKDFSADIPLKTASTSLFGFTAILALKNSKMIVV